jgi:hypothetical protein
MRPRGPSTIDLLRARPRPPAGTPPPFTAWREKDSKRCSRSCEPTPARIAHLDQDFVAASLHAHDYAPVGRRVLERVREQAVDDLSKLLGVPCHRRHVVRADRERDPAPGRRLLRSLRAFGGEGRHVHGADGPARRIRRLLDEQRCIREAHQPPGAAPGRLQAAPVLGSEHGGGVLENRLAGRA